MKNLPHKENPYVSKDSDIVRLKTSVAEKTYHSPVIKGWSGFLIQSAKCYPLLLKTFEETGGWADSDKLDEIESIIGGELTRQQLYKWFYNQRKKCGIGRKRNFKPSRFSKRAKSVLLHFFAKNSGFVSGIELDEIEESLDGELTRKQIINWFHHQRVREGFPQTK